MEGRRILWVAACAVALVLVSGSMPGAAHIVRVDAAVRETVTVPAGEYYAYGLRVPAGDSVWIEVVSADGPVDVYTVDSAAFMEYARGNPSFGFLTPGSRERATVFAEEFEAAVDGIYYIIVDNQALSGSGAQPSGDASLAVTLTRATATTEPSQAGVAVLAGIGVAWVAFLAIAWTRPSPRRGGWQRRSWWQRPGPRPGPIDSEEYNAFSEGRFRGT